MKNKTIIFFLLMCNLGFSQSTPFNQFKELELCKYNGVESYIYIHSTNSFSAREVANPSNFTIEGDWLLLDCTPEEKKFIQISNTESGNINGAGTTQFTWLDPSSSIERNTGDFAIATDGITISEDGYYKVTIEQYQVGSGGSRNNASVKVTVDGIPELPTGAQAYIRASGGHDESSATMTLILNLTTGNKVGFINERMAGTGTVTCPSGTLVFIIEEL